MRLAIRLATIAVVLLVTAAVLLTLALPRLVRSDAARARIREAVREATGREIRYGEIDFGLMPPRLVVSQTEVKGDSDGLPPVFEAEGVELEIALAPLLSWAVVVDSLVVEGATVRLVRTSEGIAFPREEATAEAPRAPDAVPPSGESPAPRPSADGATTSSPGEGSESGEEAAPSEPAGEGAESGDGDDERGFTLAVRQVDLRDSRLLLEDRTVSPPAHWEFGDVVATASGESAEAPIDFEINGAMTTGGVVQAKGEAEIGGPYRIDFRLENLSLTPVAPYLDKGQRVGGAVTGTVASTRTEDEAERVVVDVVLQGGDLAAEDLVIRGQMKLRADIEGELGDASGSFQLDATDAEVEYGVAFGKLRGTRATATGRIVTGADGQIGLEDTQVEVKDAEVEVQLERGARTRTTIDAEPFDLNGWGAVIPALAGSDPAGKIGIRGLVVETAPLEVRGNLDIHGLRLVRGDGAEMRLGGGFRGMGSEIRSEKLVARVAGKEIRLSVNLIELAGRPRFVTEVEADGVESSALLALVTEKNDTLQGPLELRGKLAGPLAADRPLAETVEGTVRIRIEPGRLKGVSVLEKTFQGVGASPDAEDLAGRLEGGRKLERYYDDEFQYLGGTLQIGRGLARTDDLKLVYHNYTVDLRGTVGLQDQQLDLRGELTIDDQIDGAIAGGDSADRKPQLASSRVIPLARVSGTLESPRVEITDEAVVRLAATYATTERREEWEEKIDKYLGEGAGGQVLEALDGILSGEPQEPRE